MRHDNIINIRLVLHTVGSLLLFEAVFMLIATIVSYIYGEPDSRYLLLSSIITLGVALLSFFLKKGEQQQLGKREGYLIVAFIWVVFSAFGSLPFL